MPSSGAIVFEEPQLAEAAFWQTGVDGLFCTFGALGLPGSDELFL